MESIHYLDFLKLHIENYVEEKKITSCSQYNCWIIRLQLMKDTLLENHEILSKFDTPLDHLKVICFKI